MRNQPVFWLGIALLVLLAACDSTPPPLPTLAANALPSETAGVSETPTITPGGRPTLPPLPSATPLPVSTPTQAEAPTAVTQTETPVSGSGMIYYLYNNDAIVSVPADRSRGEELLIRANGGRISDVSASPDGRFFVYVAPGGGSAREVFVSSRDGTYTQQVSCLGFARVLAPAWQPTGDLIAFLASQTDTGPLDIYVARLSGAGNCPTDNGQRLLVRLAPEVPPADGSVPQEGLNASELVWSADGTVLFYNDRNVYLVDIASGASLLISQATGFGPDYSLTFNAAEERLYFLHTTQESVARGMGQVTRFDLQSFRGGTARPRELAFMGQYLAWGASGEYLLIADSSSIAVYSPSASTAVPVLTGLTLPPAPVFSPDDAQIAYIATTPDLPTVQQIFVVERSGENSVQLTRHSEGTVADLIWLAN